MHTSCLCCCCCCCCRHFDISFVRWRWNISGCAKLKCRWTRSVLAIQLGLLNKSVLYLKRSFRTRSRSRIFHAAQSFARNNLLWQQIKHKTLWHHHGRLRSSELHANRRLCDCSAQVIGGAGKGIDGWRTVNPKDQNMFLYKLRAEYEEQNKGAVS